jgi:glycosyltransferase involved in cell wall biosynthesis
VEVAKRLDDDARILIVGKNVEMLRGRSEKLIFTGFVEHERIPEYIAAADVAVAPYNPAGFKDMERYGFYFSPIKIFEYMACGKPVVATDVDIVRDVIRGSDCGLLVEPGNIEQLSDAIGYLFKNKEKAIEMGRRGREAVMERYTWKNVAERIENGMKGVMRNGNV